MAPEEGRRDFSSIGEVLVALRDEFPDVTISKIRFLESEGLISPERTESGYRKFYASDVERLRGILRLQRDEYLPLKVIRERLERSGTASRSAPQPGPAEEDEPVPESEGDAQDLGPIEDGRPLSREELAGRAGVATDLIGELEQYGLIRPSSVNGQAGYGEEDVAIVQAVRDLGRYGLEPRHLTMYKHFAEREAHLFEMLITPALRQRTPRGRETATRSLVELAAKSRQLKQALLRVSLRRVRLDGPGA